MSVSALSVPLSVSLSGVTFLSLYTVLHIPADGVRAFMSALHRAGMPQRSTAWAAALIRDRRTAVTRLVAGDACAPRVVVDPANR